MRAVLTRVKHASVSIDGKETARSGDGFLVGTALQRARGIPEARFFRHHFPVGIIERGDLDPAVAFTQQMVHDHMRAGAAADDGDFHCFFRIHFICFP